MHALAIVNNILFKTTLIQLTMLWKNNLLAECKLSMYIFFIQKTNVSMYIFLYKRLMYQRQGVINLDSPCIVLPR
jgi:tryptophan-rich sensory protein